MTNTGRIDQLEQMRGLPREEMRALLERHNEADAQHLFERARGVRERVYGKAVWLRGLVEFSSYCKNDCYYCGLRRGNHKAERYRLSRAEIVDCCKAGYALGIRTFVLQSGEDPFFTDAELCEVVFELRNNFQGCAITLSLGERNRASYESLYSAGANRYLLRHETASAEHYAKLHPLQQSLASRMRCLRDLREVGFQVGCGFMVGSPGQTVDCLLDDLDFLRKFQPEMCGIGPFLPHSDTLFAKNPPGSLELTLFLLGIVRLMLPGVLLPATTALGTVHPTGREQGLRAGANIVMPNLSPAKIRGKYSLYDNKICVGEEAAESCFRIRRQVENAGYFIESAKGDPVYV